MWQLFLENFFSFEFVIPEHVGIERRASVFFSLFFSAKWRPGNHRGLPEGLFFFKLTAAFYSGDGSSPTTTTHNSYPQKPWRFLLVFFCIKTSPVTPPFWPYPKTLFWRWGTFFCFFVVCFFVLFCFVCFVLFCYVKFAPTRLTLSNDRQA